MHRTAAVLVALAGSAASAQLFPAQFELSDLDGTNGFVLNGIGAFDFSGRSVSSAGDVNGDGIDDLIIGAFGADPNGENSGESYVVFGGAGVGGTGIIELSALDGTNGFVLNGIDAGDFSGRSVSSAGDVNGDGVDDLIIGARNADPNGSSSGESYVVFGGAGVGGTGIIELSALDGTNGFVLNGIDAADGSGASVSSAGDVNGDGVDDLIIGAFGADPNGEYSGESYVVFGGAGVGGTGIIELSALDGTNGFVLNGIDASDGSGISVSSAGDVNGDGIDDLIIGAYGGDPNGNSSGESYVVFGGAGVGDTGIIELSALDGTNGFVLNGIDASDGSGISVSSAGDVNGDGIDDLIIGAQNADPNGGSSGESYVVFGGAGVGSTGIIELSALDGTNGFVLNGIDAADGSGISVSSAGDVNGDGVADLIIGALNADPNGNSSGESYVVFGGAGVGGTGIIELSALDGTNGFVLNGIDAFDISGISVSSAGDVNGDGVDDLIIGAYSADPNGSSSGESYVVFGRQGPAFELSSLNGDRGFVVNGAAADDNSGFSVSCAGDVNGDGADDIIIGAYKAGPVIDPMSGQSYVVFGGAGVGSTGAIELSAINGSNGVVLRGIDANDNSGRAVSSAGDVNADGIDDIIIGARRADPNGSDSGESYVVFGSASFGIAIDLSDLNGANGFVLNGVDAGDRSGGSVSSAGDVNADGIDDIIIGAQRGDPNGSDSGESYVIFGSASLGSTGVIELSTLNGANGFVLNGIDAGDNSGRSVSSAGDVNGDGVDDLLIGSYGDPNGNYSGESYVVFGGAGVGSSGVIELSSLNGANGYVINGIDADDFSGSPGSRAGDVNGDGVDDLIIGASFGDPNGTNSGESYVVFGGASVGSTGVIELSALNGANGFVLNGIDAYDISGGSVSAAGDVNGDGFDDLLIGARYGDPNGNANAGESYVVYGGTDIGSTGVIELSAINGSNGVVLRGIDANDNSGRAVSSAGDVNADGIDDIIIGANLGDPNGNASAGESYVVFGVGQPTPPNPADFSGDGCVDSADLAILLAAWASMPADLNGDMVTDSADLAILLAAWTGSGC